MPLEGGEGCGLVGGEAGERFGGGVPGFEGARGLQVLEFEEDSAG